MKQSQKDIVKDQLDEYGLVTRNWCLSLRITRLGAIMNTLKHEGLSFTAKNEGGDYVYRIIKDFGNPNIKAPKTIQEALFAPKPTQLI